MDQRRPGIFAQSKHRSNWASLLGARKITDINKLKDPGFWVAVLGVRSVGRDLSHSTRLQSSGLADLSDLLAGKQNLVYEQELDCRNGPKRGDLACRGATEIIDTKRETKRDQQRRLSRHVSYRNGTVQDRGV